MRRGLGGCDRGSSTRWVFACQRSLYAVAKGGAHVSHASLDAPVPRPVLRGGLLDAASTHTVFAGTKRALPPPAADDPPQPRVLLSGPGAACPTTAAAAKGQTARGGRGAKAYSGEAGISVAGRLARMVRCELHWS